MLLFFDAPAAKYSQNAKVMAVLDAIGRQTLKLGRDGFKASGKMWQNFRSPGYTTNWNELIQASQAVDYSIFDDINNFTQKLLFIASPKQPIHSDI